MALGGGDAGAGSGRIARSQPVEEGLGRGGRPARPGNCMEMAPGGQRGREGGLEWWAETRSQRVRGRVHPGQASPESWVGRNIWLGQITHSIQREGGGGGGWGRVPMEASVGTRAKGACALNQGDCDPRSQEKAACQDLLRKEDA